MNRAQCEQKMLLKPFESPAQRRLTKLLRRKLRIRLENIGGGEEKQLEKEYSSKLRDVRRRIACSRPVRIDTLKALKEVLMLRCNWVEVDREKELCQLGSVSIPRRNCTDSADKQHIKMYLFEPLDIVIDPWKIQVCAPCHSHLLNCSNTAMDIFLKHCKYSKRYISELLPVYVDYKRTVLAETFFPAVSEDFSYTSLELIEHISEDEDDGKTEDACDGKVNPYCDLTSVNMNCDTSLGESDDEDYDLLVRMMH